MSERTVPGMLALLETAPAPWEGKALQRAETAAERFGLRLSPEAYERLGEERRRALRETRRLELGEGITEVDAQAFAVCRKPRESSFSARLSFVKSTGTKARFSGTVQPTRAIRSFLSACVSG